MTVTILNRHCLVQKKKKKKILFSFIFFNQYVNFLVLVHFDPYSTFKFHGMEVLQNNVVFMDIFFEWFLILYYCLKCQKIVLEVCINIRKNNYRTNTMSVQT